jgi:hypothetical protein
VHCALGQIVLLTHVVVVVVVVFVVFVVNFDVVGCFSSYLLYCGTRYTQPSERHTRILTPVLQSIEAAVITSRWRFHGSEDLYCGILGYDTVYYDS